MTSAPPLTRREFLVATSVVGGGMALAILPCGSKAAARPVHSGITPPEITPWIVIGADLSILRSTVGRL